MSIPSTFKQNVLPPSIFGYLLIPVAVASGLIFVTLSAELKLIIFACVVFGWALFFPRSAENRVVLPKEAVDFWYYSLALVGVVIFFVANSAQRDRIELKDKLNEAKTAIERGSTERMVFADMHAKESRTAAQIKEQERDILLQINKIARVREEYRLQSLAACNALQIDRRLEGTLRDSRRLGDDPFETRDIGKIDFEAAICDANLLATYWTDLMAVSTSAKLLEIIESNSIGDSFSVNINGTFLGVGTVARYLTIASDAAAIQKVIERIDKKIADAEMKREALEESLSKKDGDRDMTISDRFAIIGHFLWPYILVTALGMKLAREPYIYG